MALLIRKAPANGGGGRWRRGHRVEGDRRAGGYAFASPGAV